MLGQENELFRSQTDSVFPFCVGLDPALRAAIGYPCLAQICLVAFPTLALHPEMAEARNGLSKQEAGADRFRYH